MRIKFDSSPSFNTMFIVGKMINVGNLSDEIIRILKPTISK